ncbi:MAG: GNAT family N-acetyltransferase [Saprospiraceae bacterium]
MHQLELVRNNFIAKVSHFARFVPGMSVEATTTYVRVDCGLPSDTFNAVVITRADFNASKSILQYYQIKNFPTAFWVFESPAAPEIEQQLIDLQLVSNELNMAMLVDLRSLQANYKATPEFTIQLASTPKEMLTHAEVLASLFEPAAEANQIKKYYQSISPYYEANTSPIQFFIGIHQEEVVSTGTLFFDQNAVGIYDIATKINVRGKGFGSQMFHYLLQVAKNQGATTAVLQASPDGLGIYKKAGFEEIGSVKVFENRHLLE